MKQALLIGHPPENLDFSYVAQPPYDAVVIGSLTLGELLCFRKEQVLTALSQGKPVYLYTPKFRQPGIGRRTGQCPTGTEELGDLIHRWFPAAFGYRRGSPDYARSGAIPCSRCRAHPLGKGNIGTINCCLSNERWLRPATDHYVIPRPQRGRGNLLVECTYLQHGTWRLPRRAQPSSQ